MTCPWDITGDLRYLSMGHHRRPQVPVVITVCLPGLGVDLRGGGGALGAWIQGIACIQTDPKSVI